MSGERMASIRKIARQPGSNVVVLPTAAPRQVRQPWDAEGRKRYRAYREANPWPGEHMHPGQRAALRKARILFEMNQTPELLIATAIFAVLSPEDRQKVEATLLASAALTGRTSQVQAATAISSMLGTYGEQNDLRRAIKRLTEERGL